MVYVWVPIRKSVRPTAHLQDTVVADGTGAVVDGPAEVGEYPDSEMGERELADATALESRRRCRISGAGVCETGRADGPVADFAGTFERTPFNKSFTGGHSNG